MTTKGTGTGVSVSANLAKPRLSVVVQSPAAGLVAQTPIVGVVVQTPVAELVAQTPVVEFVAQIPAAAISYVNLVISAELDPSGRYRIVTDSVELLDGTKFTLSKHILNEAALLTEDVRLLFEKPVIDAVTPPDRLFYAFAKSIKDQYGVSDYVARNIAKATVDAIFATDTSRKLFVKLFRDGFSLNDSLDATDGLLYSFAKGVSNVAFVSDTDSFSLGKTLKESLGLSDVLVRSFAKALTDAITTPEAVSRVTTKKVVDAQAVVDDVVRLVAKKLIDPVSVGDLSVRTVSKRLADNAAVADAAKRVVTKLVTDTLTGFSEQVTRAFTKKLTDSASLADVDRYSLSKRVVDGAIPADTIANKQVQKLLADALTITENVTRTLVYQRLLQDAFALNDSTGIGDGLAVQSIKNVANVATVGDLQIKSMNLRRTESAVLTDTGNLVSQGYCDLTYFADDYVGATRSF